MEQAEKGQVKSLVKALELLDILSNKQAPMTLRELYQVSGYPKSTIYALLSTLRAYGCIRQESDGRYYLGTKLFQWGCSVSASWDITRLARPYLERLARDTGSTALLSRVEGSSITVIDQCVSGAGIRVASEMGSHASADPGGEAAGLYTPYADGPSGIAGRPGAHPHPGLRH